MSVIIILRDSDSSLFSLFNFDMSGYDDKQILISNIFREQKKDMISDSDILFYFSDYSIAF